MATTRMPMPRKAAACVVLVLVGLRRHGHELRRQVGAAGREALGVKPGAQSIVFSSGAAEAALGGLTWSQRTGAGPDHGAGADEA
mmetsp:Transcript_36488/g.79882  ORF Transcript_36488/g.79882 Transcript_36488/m.79882 type:complete len:85 (+) Transcript_36488:120-374(+)